MECVGFLLTLSLAVCMHDTVSLDISEWIWREAGYCQLALGVWSYRIFFSCLCWVLRKWHFGNGLSGGTDSIKFLKDFM